MLEIYRNERERFPSGFIRPMLLCRHSGQHGFGQEWIDFLLLAIAGGQERERSATRVSEATTRHLYATHTDQTIQQAA